MRDLDRCWMRGLCTFSQTQKTMRLQFFFTCETCHLDGNHELSKTTRFHSKNHSFSPKKTSIFTVFTMIFTDFTLI